MKHVDQVLVVISFDTELTGQSEERGGHGGGRESEREGGREGERESSSQLSMCVHDIVFREFHGFPL